MSNILRIAAGDFLRIRNNVIACIVIIGLVVVPSLYAWFNINASWDPYGNTGNLKVAIANTDDGYNGDLLPMKINLGETLVSSIRADKNFNWHVTDKERAIDGVKSGEFYAAIVIPKSFSMDMMSLFSEDANPSSIIYYSNEKRNAIGTKITDTGADALQRQINETFTEAITEIALNTMKSLWDTQDKDGMKQLAANLDQQLSGIQDNIVQARSTLKAFSGTADSLSSLLESTEDFAANSRDMTDASRALNNEADKSIDKLITEASNSIADTQEFIKALQNLGLAEDMSDLIKETEELQSDLQTMKADLKATKKSTDKVLNNIDKVNQNVKSVSSSSRQDLKALKSAIDNTLPALVDSENAISRLKGRIDKATESGDLDELSRILAGDTEEYSAFMASPVTLKTTKIYPVENYGSAMAPFYSSLAIWVGGVILVALLSVSLEPARRRALDKLRAPQIYLGRYIMFLIIGLMQTMLICLGDLLFLGIQCVHPLLFICAGLFASVVFVNIIYTLTASFGNIGKAIAVILMIIQVAGSGGTFPIQMMPEFFQNLYPLMPFAHSMTAMREAIAGTYGGIYAREMCILAVFLVASLLLGLVFRTPMIRANAAFNRKLKDTKLM